MTSNVCMTLNN